MAAAYQNLGVALAESNQAEKAENALGIRPYDAKTHANLAKLLASRDDIRMEEAQRQIEAAVKNDPHLAEAHDLLGGMLEMKGKIAAAQHEYEEALRIKPELARARLNLGALLAGRGDRAGAIHNLQLASQSSDMEINEQARRALQELSVNR